MAEHDFNLWSNSIALMGMVGSKLDDVLSQAAPAILAGLIGWFGVNQWQSSIKLAELSTQMQDIRVKVERAGIDRYTGTQASKDWQKQAVIDSHQDKVLDKLVDIQQRTTELVARFGVQIEQIDKAHDLGHK